MITCVIQYTLDPHAIEDFEKYVRRRADRLLPAQGGRERLGDRADRL
jgi:hypothetical protein